METVQVLTQQTKRLNKFIAIATPIAIVVGGAFWYYQNVWRPNVKVVQVDYETGIAIVTIGRKRKTILAGSVTSAGGGWGVRFAPFYSDEKPTRIELVKNDLVYRVL